MKNEKSKTLLFVFDFDGTIVSGHTHNAIIAAKAKANAEGNDSPEPWDVVRDFKILGSTDTWKNIFETSIQQEHSVAIASFNAFEEIIPKFLNKIGLDEDHIKKINIITGFPADPKTSNKNEYIQQAIEKSVKNKAFSGNPEDVIFIDDSFKNNKAAKQLGYQVIHAKKDASHLIEIQKKLEELKKLEEKAPPVDRNAKPKKPLSESELRELEIKTLEKQEEELKKQEKELEKQRKDHLEEINIYSNSETILFNDPNLDKLDLAYKANYDQLSEVTSKLSKLQSQVHNDKPATVSKEVIEQSPQRTVDSQIRQLKQEIKKYQNMREENIEKISQLLPKKNLSSEENLILSSLKLDLSEITAVIKVKAECLEKIEKLDVPVVDSNNSKPIESTQTKNQGAVPKKKPNADKPEINPVAKTERPEQTKDSQKPLFEVSKSTQQPKDLLKAQSKKDKFLENSSTKDVSAFKDKQKLIGELLAKPRKSPLGTSVSQTTLFASSGNSSSSDKTKTQEKKTKRIEFSR